MAKIAVNEMHRVTTIEVADTFIYGLAFEGLVRAAKQNLDNHDVTIEASSDFYEELTGEQLLEALHANGAQVEFTRDPITGEIDSIEASVGLSVDATAVSPAKLLGDLAQTSITLNGSEVQIIGLAEWTLSWKQKTADATTTDDATYESSLPSTKSWSVKAKYMFLDGDPSQVNILNVITAVQTPLPWNFFPTEAIGRTAFSGMAYVESIDFSTGIGKVCGLDVSLKGTGQLKIGQQIAPVANPNTGTGQQAEV